MRDLAHDEVNTLTASIDTLLYDMKVLLLPKDPRDRRHIFIEIQGSASSRETWQFLYDLGRIYARYIEAQKWKWKSFGEYSDGLSEPKTFLFHVAESGIYQSLKFEQGIHQIVSGNNADSVTAFNISVEVFADADQNDVQLDMNDVEVQVFRVRGTGGISDSGVRMTHIPTGISVDIQDRRSQLRNKHFAEKMLIAKLRCLQHRQIDSAKIVRTYNIEQDTVIDHRLNDMTFSLSDLINGGLHKIINPLLKQEQLRLFKEYNL